MALTATNILNAQQILNEAWPGSQVEKDMIVHSQAAQAVMANQQVSSNFAAVLKDKDKDRSVDVTWFDRCFGGVRDCTPSCTITGAGVNTLKQTYTLDLCKETVPVSIGEEQWRTNQYNIDGALAVAMQQNLKSMDEFLSQQVLINLHAYAALGKNFQLNNRGSGTTYNQANGTTYIPDAQYNPSLLSYLSLAAIINQSTANYKISDEKFWIPIDVAKTYATNLNGAGLAKQADELSQNLYFDLWNFASSGITDDLFIVEKSAVLFLTKARFDSNPVYYSGDAQQWRWSQASPTIPGVVYDFFLKETCNNSYSATQEDIVHNMKIKVHYGIWNNPLGCTITKNGVTGKSSGVLSFTANATGAIPT